MPSDNIIPLSSYRVAAKRKRRRTRIARGLTAALALALAPVSSVADGAPKLPPGHPPVGAQRLPPGHPPIPGHDGAATCNPDLPQGHPAVRDPRVPEGHPPVEVGPCAPAGTSSGVFHPDAMPSFAEPGVVET